MKIALLVLTFLAVLLTPLYPVYAEENVMYKDSTTSGRPPKSFLPPKPKQATDSGNFKPKRLKEASAGGILEFRQKKQERMDGFKSMIQGFKDQKKAERAERINTNLDSLSERVLGVFTSILEKFSGILDRAETKLANAPDGEKKTNAQSAINNAKASLAETEQLLDEFSMTDYTLVISSESTVREEAMDVRNTLRDDLAKIRESLIGTQKSVIEAVRAVNSAAAEGESNGQ